MYLGLAGKTVLITGGSKGIGLACAHSLSAAGCIVYIASRSESTLNAAADQIERISGKRPYTVAVDLANSSERTSLMSRMQDIDILINNAGAIPGGGFDQITEDLWRQVWDLKVYGYIEMTRLMLAHMEKRENPGVILNVIGMAGVTPSYDYLCGSTANAALISFTKAVGGYVAGLPSGIRVLGVNPGPTSTDRLVSLYQARAVTQYGNKERWTNLVSDLPFGRPAEANEIADLVTFLVSKKANYLNGVVIDVDGGAAYGVHNRVSS